MTPPGSSPHAEANGMPYGALPLPTPAAAAAPGGDRREEAVLEYLRGSRALVEAQRDVLLRYLGAAPAVPAAPHHPAPPAQVNGWSPSALVPAPVAPVAPDTVPAPLAVSAPGLWGEAAPPRTTRSGPPRRRPGRRRPRR